MDKTFSGIYYRNDLGQSPRAIEIKAKINKWDLIRLKIFCKAKETTNNNKKTQKCMEQDREPRN